MIDYFFDGELFDIDESEEITFQGVRDLGVSLGFFVLCLPFSHQFS
jgi:hypothetical protein